MKTVEYKGVALASGSEAFRLHAEKKFVELDRHLKACHDSAVRRGEILRSVVYARIKDVAKFNEMTGGGYAFYTTLCPELETTGARMQPYDGHLLFTREDGGMIYSGKGGDYFNEIAYRSCLEIAEKPFNAISIGSE